MNCSVCGDNDYLIKVRIPSGSLVTFCKYCEEDR